MRFSRNFAQRRSITVVGKWPSCKFTGKVSQSHEGYQFCKWKRNRVFDLEKSCEYRQCWQPRKVHFVYGERFLFILKVFLFSQTNREIPVVRWRYSSGSPRHFTRIENSRENNERFVLSIFILLTTCGSAENSNFQFRKWSEPWWYYFWSDHSKLVEAFRETMNPKLIDCFSSTNEQLLEERFNFTNETSRIGVGLGCFWNREDSHYTRRSEQLRREPISNIWWSSAFILCRKTTNKIFFGKPWS